MKSFLMAVVAAVLVCGGVVENCFALPPFKKAFDERYTNKVENADFKAAAKKEGCNICHVKGEKDKKKQNEYGKELNKLIEGDAEHRLKDAEAAGKKDEETKKILAELEEAFKKVEAMKNEAGETYGDRIKAGKLPVEPKS